MQHLEIPAWAAALESSTFAQAMRDSLVLYPLANLLHILGLILLVGSILVLDLRLLGAAKGIALPDANRLLSRMSAVGVVLMLLTGFSLFSADAGPLSITPLLWAKWWLIALGIINALTFQGLWRRRLPNWDAAPPTLGRLQAVASIVLWLAAAICGRLLAYL